MALGSRGIDHDKHLELDGSAVLCAHFDSRVRSRGAALFLKRGRPDGLPLALGSRGSCREEFFQFIAGAACFVFVAVRSVDERGVAGASPPSGDGELLPAARDAAGASPPSGDGGSSCCHGCRRRVFSLWGGGSSCSARRCGEVDRSACREFAALAFTTDLKQTALDVQFPGPALRPYARQGGGTDSGMGAPARPLRRRGWRDPRPRMGGRDPNFFVRRGPPPPEGCVSPPGRGGCVVRRPDLLHGAATACHLLYSRVARVAPHSYRRVRCRRRGVGLSWGSTPAPCHGGCFRISVHSPSFKYRNFRSQGFLLYRFAAARKHIGVRSRKCQCSKTGKHWRGT